MQYIIIFFLVQFVNFQNHYYFVDALIGRNVRDATEEEFRNVVCIMLLNRHSAGSRNLRLEVRCTGTMISRDHVLTAEHCLYYYGMNGLMIRAGSIDIRQGTKFYIAFWITYDQWCTVEEKDIEYEMNDIAIIKLIDKVPETLRPAVLSTVENSNLFGINVSLAGWGKIEDDLNPYVMRTAQTTIISNQDCETLTARFIGYVFDTENNALCSISDPPAHVYQGDSGGPVFVGEILVAISQGTCPRGVDMGDPRKVNVHYSVYYYRPFIEFLMHI